MCARSTETLQQKYYLVLRLHLKQFRGKRLNFFSTSNLKYNIYNFTIRRFGYSSD